MQTDYVQRFLFEDLDIRGRLVCLTGAWQRMLDGRDYPEDIAHLLGHTTALNVLLGATQKGAGRVTLQVQGSGPVKLLVADCTPELRIRGMAQYERQLEGKNERSLLGNGRLAVTLEDMKSGQLYRSSSRRSFASMPTPAPCAGCCSRSCPAPTAATRTAGTGSGTSPPRSPWTRRATPSPTTSSHASFPRS